ncbi:MAG: methyltransferase domain-containing protein [Streptosporangiales bacterium]|nr:methyltransferase domain-containing protein [Streptosporangiales bacterium]
MGNADRISELYKAEIWDEQAQRIARHRIGWLVDQARGAVLDVGCSQGITSILCARRGLRTLGVDVEPDRIEYALADRIREPEVVRELLEFRVGDARRLDLPDASFDTVLLGEVVEHHVDASPILAEVVRLLRPAGVFALTTPFGYLPHHDHRATFYVSSLLSLLTPFVTVETLDVVDGYFRALCRPGSMPLAEQRELLAGLQPVVEDEFHRAQRELRETRARTRSLDSQLAAATSRAGELEARLESAQHQNAQLAVVADRLAEVERHTARLAGIERELHETRQSTGRVIERQEATIGQLTEELRTTKSRLAEAQARATKLDAVAAELRRTQERLRWQSYRTQYVTWQLSSSFARRWWRIGQAFWKVQKEPSRFLEFPADMLRAIRKNSRPQPPTRPRPAASDPRVESRGASAVTSLRGAPGDSATVPDIPELVLPDGPVVRQDMTVAVILDEFSATALRYEWRQVEPGRADWREVLEREQPWLLFVESTWQGNGGRWTGQLEGPKAPGRELRELVSWCRGRGIPTVFWNKEDPSNFDRFLEAAKLFDWVFTVDGDCIPRYREALGHDRIRVLPFAAQPRLHNPISLPGGRRYGVAFGGMYFSHRHPERAEQMRTLLEPAREFGLHIFSRHLGGDSRYQFPSEYDGHVVGSLPYRRMLAAYRSYRVFLNVNSVTESPTMCARRIFELSACGTPILSGHSRAIEEMFGDLVATARTQEEARALLGMLLASPHLRDRQTHLAMREVFARHTYTHRVGTVLETLGMPTAHRTPSASVIMATNRPEQLTHAIEQVARQRWRPLQLVLVRHGDGADPEVVRDKAIAHGVEDVVVRSAEASSTLGACLNMALEATDGELVAKMDDDDVYGEHYLSDLIPAFSYTDAGIVGKRAFHVHLGSTGATVLRSPHLEHSYVDMVMGATMVARADILRELGFTDVSRGEDTRLQQRAAEAGVRIYSGDRYSYVCVRQPSPEAHTWQVGDGEFLRNARVEFYGAPEQHVLI